MFVQRAAFFALALCGAACGGPIAEPTPPSGELIAFGGGPSGPQNACFSCHGFRGEGDGEAPRLAGIAAGYLAKQLDDYARERRPDAVMTPIARRMSDGDRLAVARYYAGLAAPERARALPALTLYHEGDPARGVRACANCHGAEGRGRGQANPAIAAQPASYTREQLRRWKYSIRRNDPRDVMGAAARALSDDEIEALALYIEQL